jgi:hypothetical protein
MVPGLASGQQISRENRPAFEVNAGNGSKKRSLGRFVVAEAKSLKFSKSGLEFSR